MTELPETDTEVRVWPFCCISMIVAPDGPTPPALAPLKVTVPKLAKGTRLLPDEKSSTIHSALVWQSDGWPEKVCDTVWPRELFLMVAVPPVKELAETVTLMLSPAARVIPVKSWAKSGNHSNQAAKETALPCTQKSRPV